MKKNILLCIICSLSILPTIASCDSKPATSDTNTTVDYTAQLKFDENSGRKWEKTTLKQAIDGDTAHFNVSWADNGVYKARFLGIDTPESTGQIQAWGKAASKFTGEKLSTAYSIIIESNAAEWELDATGSRYTTWVWYQATADADYRLINLEIVQNGYSLLKNAGSTVYGEYFTKAFNQATEQKLNLAGNKKDPDFYYGAAKVVDMSELVLHKEDYSGIRVRFEGLITFVDGSTTFYMQWTDSETSEVYGMQVFVGYNWTGVELLQIGTYMSVCGVFSSSDIVSRWQVSSLVYYEMIPDHEENVYVISEGNEVKPVEITYGDLSGKTKKTFINEATDEKSEVEYENGFLNLGKYVTMKNLTVTSTYTTHNGGDNDGALTLTCKDANNNVVTVRTEKLYNADGSLVTASAYEGKKINIVGIVNSYNDSYQVQVYRSADITIL